MHSYNIVLIGFMGVGKGSLARALARETGMYAVDTDDLIESLENRRIKRIFKKDGEAYFRELEQKTSLWLEQGVSNCIISTGGGFHSVENLNRIGTVVYLRSDFDSIVDRMLAHPNAKNKIAKRPLLKNRKKARELFARRTPEYERKADITIDVAGKDIPTIVRELLAKLG
jgi:shikimate kinase